ncbi:MAG: right-handed parallel beta-helix repeat-containing protein [Candidatus Cloacimonadota bacterium]|nr:right-handed parallel beta-helix repeat-containing protein [Candidatus Cloacimonadota bacterium]
MKKILLSICLLLLTISVFATNVSGNQSGIWNLAGSPYNIIGEITVPTNETLQIEAGVEVVAMGNYKITALGNIIVEGTVNDTIRFYGNGGSSWGGIRLEDEVNESQFNYCRISNTDETNNYPIQTINSPIFINHSYFDDHDSGISFFALSSDDPSYMEIKNSKITNIQKSGITITDNSNALIDSCEITQCGLGTQFYGAIRLLLMDNSHSCSPTITNNYIHHNDKQGIILANLYGYDNMTPTVEYNEISYNYTGIYLYVGKGYYKGNHIHHNFVENNPDSGAGVMLYGNGADAIFTYNEVNNNYTGFYLTNGATANLGDLSNGSTDDDGYNQIHDNEFYTGEIFSVYNASVLDMKTENNSWDSDDPEVIDITIIDGNDNPAYGIVDYEPHRSPYPPPTNVVFGPEAWVIYWEPPELSYTYATLTGYNVYLDDFSFPLATVGIDVFEYEYVDLVNGQEYVGGVSAVYEEGESGILEVIFWPWISAEEELQSIFNLSNYPNPFNPTTTISFNLTTEYTENTEIVIYNLKGQKVKTLDCSNLFAAASKQLMHSITWNGTDDFGKPVSSGIYFYKLVSDGKNIASKKMLLLK